MTDHNPHRPVGSGLPPERDRLAGGPLHPENRVNVATSDRGNSAMALIVGALAVALIIGAFFWFAGDTQDTANLDNPATVEEETVTTDEPVLQSDDDVIINDDADVTEVAPADDVVTPTDDTAATDDADVIDETQQGATDQPEDGEVIDQTQQN